MTSNTPTSSGPWSGAGQHPSPGAGRGPGRTRRRSRLATAIGTAVALTVGSLTAATAAGAAPGVAAAPAAPVVASAPSVIPPTTVPPTATYNIDLCATAGTATFPSGTATSSVSFWGYTADATCATALTHPGGPTLVVDQGATVTVNLHNNLAEPTSLSVEGQGLVPDQTGTTTVAGKSYTFTAAKPGTFLYQAGLTANAQQEIALGLYGALVVRPLDGGGQIITNQAYAGAGSAFNASAVLLLSELDPALTPTNYLGFDMRNYAPTFGLVNGVPFPGTTTLPATTVPATAGDAVLLRYLNAGSLYHSMSALGANQTMLATDGHLLPDPFEYVAETFGPGQSADVLLNVPAATPTGSKLTLFEGSMALRNAGKKTNLASSKAFGGLMTFITVGTAAAGPVTTNAAYAAGVLTATVTDPTPGVTTNVAGAEYFLDMVGATGSGTPMTATDLTFDAKVEAVTATVAVPTGNHILYLHGRDSSGVWGPMVAASVTAGTVDTTGPIVSGPTVTPAITGGATPVALHATADDTTTGGSPIAGGEYYIDETGTPAPGTGTAMAANLAATVASLDATIPAAVLNGLPAGSHVISIRAKDSVSPAANWGPFTTVSVTVDKVGPAVQTLAANPNPTNGVIPVNSSSASVRVTAMLSDASAGGSAITNAEMFLCITPAACTLSQTGFGTDGTGIALTPSDGIFNSPVESVYGDIPLTTVRALTDGGHTVYVHGRDAAGSWGPTSSITLVADKAVPTLTGIALAPASILAGATSVTMTLTGAADPAPSSGLPGGEYWFGTTDITAGAGTQFTGTTPVAINTASLAVGSYTVRARIRDAAGNWSVVRTATLTVSPNAIFSNNFNTGGGNWGWSSRSTNSTARMNVVTSPLLEGARTLQAQGNNTNYVQYNFGTAANPASGTVDARFYFRPNGNTSNGQDIFATSTTTGFNATLFRVRYRLNSGIPQVQLQIGGTANATWSNILGGTSTNTIEVVWTSGTSLQLYVNGTLAQTLTTTTTGLATAFRLGSVTSGGSATVEYFDAFVAKRSTTPLVGP